MTKVCFVGCNYAERLNRMAEKLLPADALDFDIAKGEYTILGLRSIKTMTTNLNIALAALQSNPSSASDNKEASTVFRTIYRIAFDISNVADQIKADQLLSSNMREDQYVTSLTQLLRMIPEQTDRLPVAASWVFVALLKGANMALLLRVIRQVM